MPKAFPEVPVDPSELVDQREAEAVMRLSVVLANAAENGFTRRDAVLGAETLEPHIYVVFGQNKETLMAARITYNKVPVNETPYAAELKRIDSAGTIHDHGAVLLLDGSPEQGMWLDSYNLEMTPEEINQLLLEPRKLLTRGTRPLTHHALDEQFRADVESIYQAHVEDLQSE